MLRRLVIAASASVIGGFSAINAPGGVALAAGPTFMTIDYPGAVFTLAVDINNTGQIVGRYVDTAGVNHGFLRSGGSFSSITFPGAAFTRAIGINRYGDIVGDASGMGNNNWHGYMLRGGTFTSIEVPNADHTIAQGINASDDIVGTYVNSQGTHGFLLHAGTFSSIDFPGADAYTQAWKINDTGEIVGRYEGGDGKYHVYTLSNGIFGSVPDFPGAVQTAPGAFTHVGGVNNAGGIVASYCSSTPCDLLNSTGDLHGFLLNADVYTAIDFPEAAGTLSMGVNSVDDVVGGYRESSGAIHGYLRTP